MDASAVADDVMNMMTICSFAACPTEDPARSAPVIIPGIATIPMTLINKELAEVIRARGSGGRRALLHASFGLQLA